MKKALVNTKVTVKLRKAEKRNEWYLYLEAYPVFTAERSVPQRTREYLNRTIATPLWDKSRNARTSKEGNVSLSRNETSMASSNANHIWIRKLVSMLIR